MSDTPRAFPFGGMSLRDWMAAQAMAALIAKIPLAEAWTVTPELLAIRKSVAASAYGYADNMLAERATGGDA